MNTSIAQRVKVPQRGTFEWKIYRYGILYGDLSSRQADQKMSPMSEADIAEMKSIEMDLEMLPGEIVRKNFEQFGLSAAL